MNVPNVKFPSNPFIVIDYIPPGDYVTLGNILENTSLDELKTLQSTPLLFGNENIHGCNLMIPFGVYEDGYGDEYAGVYRLFVNKYGEEKVNALILREGDLSPIQDVFLKSVGVMFEKGSKVSVIFQEYKARKPSKLIQQINELIDLNYKDIERKGSIITFTKNGCEQHGTITS